MAADDKVFENVQYVNNHNMKNIVMFIFFIFFYFSLSLSLSLSQSERKKKEGRKEEAQVGGSKREQHSGTHTSHHITSHHITFLADHILH